ncbi:MAG TPA: phosphoenolpyruvate carboxykinase domain-containing protein, partial [Sorangium sp.]|nr:phosphoenolpyruvate carboxykinase domain-containing protein [Sorangium sp.]
LRWIAARVSGAATGRDTPLGIMPADGELDTSGLGLSDEAVRELFAVDRDAWLEEARDREAFLGSFGSRTPEALLRQNRDLTARIQA